MGGFLETLSVGHQEAQCDGVLVASVSKVVRPDLQIGFSSDGNYVQMSSLQGQELVSSHKLGRLCKLSVSCLGDTVLFWGVQLM